MPQQKIQNNNLNWLVDILFISFAIGIFYFFWLGHHPLFTPDEGRYSEVAREMVTTGDYITPRINGVAFLDKPILYYWLQAAAIKLFGLTEWALRFWPAIFGLIGCIATYTMGRKLYNRRTGWLAAIILASTSLHYGAAHYANLDLEVATWITLTLFTILAGFLAQKEKIRSLLFWLAWIFTSGAFLTKGMIALVFPILISCSWLLFSKQIYIITKMKIPTGIIIFSILVIPWYFLVEQANPGFLHFFFITQQITRFLSHADFNNQAPFWFYLPVVLLGFFPWSIFAIQSIRKNLNRQILKTSTGFLVFWVAIVFIFFSIPKSKTIGYILPICPPLALLIAKYINDAWLTPIKAHKSAVILYLVTAFILLPIICIVMHIQHHRMIYWVIRATIIFLSSAIMLYWQCVNNKKIKHAIYNLIICSTAFYLLFAASGKTLNENSIKPLISQLKPLLKTNPEVITYYKYYQDLPIYLNHKIKIVEDWNSPIIEQHDNWVRELWYGINYQPTANFLINETIFWSLWQRKHNIIVLMDKRRFQKFKTSAGKTIKKSGYYKDIAWASN